LIDFLTIGSSADDFIMTAKCLEYYECDLSYSNSLHFYLQAALLFVELCVNSLENGI
jgi:hypothetical protein